MYLFTYPVLDEFCSCCFFSTTSYSTFESVFTSNYQPTIVKNILNTLTNINIFDKKDNIMLPLLYLVSRSKLWEPRREYRPKALQSFSAALQRFQK
jgi:hypothetical protein